MIVATSVVARAAIRSAGCGRVATTLLQQALLILTLLALDPIVDGIGNGAPPPPLLTSASATIAGSARMERRAVLDCVHARVQLELTCLLVPPELVVRAQLMSTRDSP